MGWSACLRVALALTFAFLSGTSANSQGFFIGTYSSHILSYGSRDNVSIVANAPLEFIRRTTSGPNPSWLATDPHSRFLFAVSESVASVSSLRIDRTTGTLQLLNTVSSGGAAPCHIAVDPFARFLLVSNYCGGSISILPILEDGRLGEARTYAQDSSGIATSCSGPSHVHQAVLLPEAGGSNVGDQVALVVDLGLRRIVRYNVSWEATGRPVLTSQTTVLQLPAGSGPRHVEFHPWLPIAYVLDELRSELVLCSVEGINAFGLRQIGAVTTLRAHENRNGMAAAEVETDGRHVFVSNRDRTSEGRDSIVIFDVDQSNGSIAGSPQHFSSLGQEPRFFALYPPRKLAVRDQGAAQSLLVANQKGNSIAEFAIKQDGSLELRVVTRDVPAPSHILAADFEVHRAISTPHGEHDAFVFGGGPAFRGSNKP